MWWIFWLWFAVPSVAVETAFYPPVEAILLQNSGQVQLRWGRPGQKFVVRFWQGEVLQSQVTTTERSFPVSVKSGGVEERAKNLCFARSWFLSDQMIVCGQSLPPRRVGPL